MTTLSGELDRFTGLRAIFADNAETWTLRSGSEGRGDRRRALLWYYGLPFLVAAALCAKRAQLANVGQILSGVAVFTALLFGLLILMFNTGVTLRKDGALIANAHDLRGLIGAIRANATYAATVAMGLAVVLVVAAATADPGASPSWLFTPPVVFLGLHLILLLLTILRRLRTAFNYITR